MQKAIALILVLSLINLTACSSLSGNVVPKAGPTMEEVYDHIENVSPMEKVRIDLADESLPRTKMKDFYSLPNPELTMYVFPHFAGKDEVPIPGYDTVFNAYEHAHYFLSNELK